MRIVHRTDAALAAAALLLGPALSGCGPNAPSESTAATDDLSDASSQGPGNVLTVTDAAHRAFTLSPDRVTCGRPSQGTRSHGLDAVKVTYTGRTPLRGVDIEVLPV